ncbi:hypothetical protein DL770_007510 [Monosporascus sp. CRB-9-2]|nr:hypothetical protein DL770_007510 [Monosporascus sp. CRB-9-2]
MQRASQVLIRAELFKIGHSHSFKISQNLVASGMSNIPSKPRTTTQARDPHPEAISTTDTHFCTNASAGPPTSQYGLLGPYDVQPPRTSQQRRRPHAARRGHGPSSAQRPWRRTVGQPRLSRRAYAQDLDEILPRPSTPSPMGMGPGSQESWSAKSATASRRTSSIRCRRHSRYWERIHDQDHGVTATKCPVVLPAQNGGPGVPVIERKRLRG